MYVIGKKPDERVTHRWLGGVVENKTPSPELKGKDTVWLVLSFHNAKKFHASEEAEAFLSKHALTEDYTCYRLGEKTLKQAV